MIVGERSEMEREGGGGRGGWRGWRVVRGELVDTSSVGHQLFHESLDLRQLGLERRLKMIGR